MSSWGERVLVRGERVLVRGERVLVRDERLLVQGERAFVQGGRAFYQVGQLGPGLADGVKRFRLEHCRGMAGVVIGVGCHCSAIREFLRLMTMVRMRKGKNSREAPRT